MKRLASFIFFAGAAVLLVAFVLRAFFYYPQGALPQAAFATASSTPAGDTPARIDIPAASVDAPIQSRGIVAGSRMQAPSNFTSVGWYEYGAAPGEKGTAVLYGHLDNGLGLDGVFKNLGQVALGDPITVTTDSGQALDFKVSAIATYPYQDVPSSVLGEGTTSPGAELSLITCAGTLIYDPTLGFTYDHRLVVTATYLGTT